MGPESAKIVNIEQLTSAVPRRAGLRSSFFEHILVKSTQERERGTTGGETSGTTRAQDGRYGVSLQDDGAHKLCIPELSGSRSIVIVSDMDEDRALEENEVNSDDECDDDKSSEASRKHHVTQKQPRPRPLKRGRESMTNYPIQHLPKCNTKRNRNLMLKSIFKIIKFDYENQA